MLSILKEHTVNVYFERNDAAEIYLLHIDKAILPFQESWFEELVNAPAADGFTYLRTTVRDMNHWSDEQRSALDAAYAQTYQAAKAFASTT